MSKQDSVDEVFGLHTPNELDVTKIKKYFDDLVRVVNHSSKVLKYCDEEEGREEAVENIVSELSWVEDDVHRLIEFYNDAQDLISAYRSIAEDRMTDDEEYEYKTIMVRNKLEAVK